MDGYRDPYYISVAARYFPRYPLRYDGEGRSSSLIPPADPLYRSYSRTALDAYAGHGTSIPYQTEIVPPSTDFYSPRRRPYAVMHPAKQNNVKRRRAPAENFAPKKKLFKKTQKEFPAESQGSNQRRGTDRNLALKEQKNAGNAQISATEVLVKETLDLHRLFRTGVDSPAGMKNSVKATVKISVGAPGKKSAENRVAAQERKAEEEKEVKISASSKKRKAKKRSRKERQKEAVDVAKPAEAPKIMQAEKSEPAALTEEEKKQMDSFLELQHAVCRAVAEFLGLPEKSAEPDPTKSKPVPAETVVSDSNVETPVEVQEKIEVAPTGPTPEEEKELEEKGYTFFSKTLEENGDLRKLYLEKKDGGTFRCLICHASNPETSKNFSNLTTLVMHTSMRKQRRPEHRGYGKAICDILGWEVTRGAKNRPAKQVAGNDVQVEK